MAPATSTTGATRTPRYAASQAGSPPRPSGPEDPGGPPGFHPEIDDRTRKRLKERDGEENRVVVRWIIKTSKQHLPGIALLMCFSVINSLASIGFALVSQEAINSAVAGDRRLLVIFAIALACIGVAQILVRALSNYWQERVSARVENSYRSRLFDHILTRDFQQLSQYHSGDLLNRMTDDINIIVSGVTSFLPTIAEMIANLVGAGSVLLLTDWRFCLIYIAATVVLVIVNRVYRHSIKRFSATVREKDGNTRSFFQDAIGSMLVLRVFVTEKRAREQADELLDDFYTARIERSKVRIKSNSIMGLSMNFGHIFALVWCSFQLVNGQISYGSLVAILQLTGQVRQPFISASNLSSQYYAMIASGERLMEIEQLDAELNEQERELVDTGFDARSLYPSLTRISIDDLSFSYGQDPDLQHITVDFEKGQSVAIMGQSGCGKTTLFKLMLGVYRPSDGSLWLEGNGDAPEFAQTLDDGSWHITLGPTTRHLFAYVPQGNLLISGRLRDNVAYANPQASDEKVWEALHIACADEFVHELPQELDTVIGEHGAGLSEGQVQRIAIARAYLSGAPVMLLDEATSSLDEATEARLLANLQALENRTCLIVTHRKAALTICNAIVRIQDGKIMNKA